MIRIFKFKKNDLNPSAGKQIEYSVSDVRDFFHFSTDEVTVHFRYISHIEGDYLNGLKFTSTFKLSPARGDYKCYGNPDGSINLKNFFLDKLHLSVEENIEDFYALKKISETDYILSYFPKDTEFSEVAEFFFSQNTDISGEKELKEHDEMLDQPLQLIYYGAPGTGKSFTIDQVTNENNSVRTTFHPDSDYASFVGAYKPTMAPMPINAFVGTTVHHAKNAENEKAYEKKIVYKYVPQAFLKAYVEAWKRYAAGEDNPYYLVIEEINRGNCAQIFGDLFQLLDRNNMGCSSYAISADEDIAQFLREDDKGFGKLTEGQKEAISKFRLKKDSGVEEHIGPEILNGSKLLLPPNLRIWATMNTSDQSLFPIDSAFKRRWNWEYMPIEYDPTDKNTGERLAWKFEVRGKRYYWGKFLDYINPKILKLTMSEDKQMGYFFAKPDKRGTDGRLDVISEKVFVNKVLFYLWTDVFKDYDLTEKPFVYETTTAEGKSIKKSYRFTDFFPIEGNQKLIDFVRGMGLKVEDDGEQTPEQPSDENPTNIGNYVVNGTPVRFQNAVGAEAIKAYMSIYPEKTANEVVEDWKGLGQIVSYFVQTEAEHQARTDSRKDYVITIDCKGENIYVSKEGWGDNRPNGSIYALLNMVNAIKQKGWPIEIKGVE
jgi:type II restriction-modification system restriction subunit